MKRCMKAFSTALLLGLLVLASNVEAQEAPAITESDVLTEVERSFPLLKAAELERAIATADMLSAEGGFDLAWKTKGTVTPVGYYESVRVESMLEKPTALWGSSAFAGWKLGTGDFAVYDGRLQTLEYGEVRGGLNVPLWRNGPIDRRRASLSRAELGNDIAKLTVAQQRIEYRRSAATRYWAWVAAGRRVAIANELLANVITRDTALSARVEHGDVPAIDRADNARAIEQRRSQLASARRGLEQAAIELSLFLRDSSGAPRLPSENSLPRFPDPPRDGPSIGSADYVSAISKRPDARRLELQVRQNRIELDWAKNQLAPGIDLQVAGSQDIGRSIASRPDLSKPVLEATVLLDIPIQTRVMRGRADSAAATITRLEHQKRYTQERIQADVRDAQSAIRASLSRIEAARNEVRIAKELESAEQLRFEQGDSHLLMVNIREQQTAEAELREVDAIFDYYRATADLRAARGD